jgi:hypothetical protein
MFTVSEICIRVYSRSVERGNYSRFTHFVKIRLSTSLLFLALANAPFSSSFPTKIAYKFPKIKVFRNVTPYNLDHRTVSGKPTASIFWVEVP